MSLCNVRGLFATDTKQPEGAAVAALRDIDTVSHKKYRSAYRRINQCFLKAISASVFDNTGHCLCRNSLSSSGKAQLFCCCRFNIDRIFHYTQIFCDQLPHCGNIGR